jgi:endonuclease-3
MQQRMTTASDLKPRAGKIIRQLSRTYAGVTTALRWSNPLELLVATILSAQCTDERVNVVTKDLFRKYRTAADFAHVSPATLEREIQSTGFFRNKAKSIRACCQELDETYGGQVPDEMAALVDLPGVGRKTANVVLGTAFGIPSGIVVDTHVARVSSRLGLTENKDPVKIEQDLMAVIPKKQWIDFAHQLIHHGRQICVARKPRCTQCPLLPHCPRVGLPPLTADA